MEKLFFKSAEDLSQMLAKKSLSSVELTQIFLQRIKAVEPKVQAFLSLDEEKSLQQAKASDERRAKGQSLGLLDGIPVGMKDVIAEKG
jgi:aspartyl-tRNA(Asn)/glutamyl-tRNA(Gln) amidotransferase subunit A